MMKLRSCLYSFLGLHSFLIGLFPFYIPVYLFAKEFSLQRICLFIAVTGLGFCLCLFLWERVCRLVPLRFLLAVSFLTELVLLSLFFLEDSMIFLFAAGIANGVFNCNFWIIQRLLFLETITPADSGKKFGNFQIFVLVVLKIAIFIGGIVLESSGFITVYFVSLLVVAVAVISFLLSSGMVELDGAVRKSPPLSLVQIVSFRDGRYSRVIFVIDGVFLYLESYFWVVSLFFIVDRSFSKLGFLVVILTVAFGLLFLLIKNSIDRLPADLMYRSAVLLYCLSWFMRGGVSEELSTVPLLLLLAAITFSTSYFRLAFNKRFYDIAKSETAHEYIFIKSYFSQLFLVLIVLIPVLTRHVGTGMVDQLAASYLGAAVFSVIYLLYRRETVS